MGLEESLAAAGLAVVADCCDTSRLLPAIATSQAPSCPIDERFSESMFEIADPALIEKANAAWYRMSIEAGLFTEADRRFLIPHADSDEGPSRWICVELQDSWDIVGKGAAGPLGSTPGHPEFRMLSLDGTVLSSGTTGEFDISIFVMKTPSKSAIFRRFAEWVATADFFHAEDAAAARRWLETQQ